MCWLCKHMDLHTMPSGICVVMYIDGPKWRNGDPLCGKDVPLDIVQTEFLGHSRVRGCGESNPIHSIPVLPCIPMGQPQWPRHNHTKVGLFPGCIYLHKFPLHDHSNCPVNKLGSHHDWYLLRIGHSWFGQQQDILIVAPYTGGSHLSHTAVKLDSHLAQIYLPNFLV